jgi:hypothetical protein
MTLRPDVTRAQQGTIRYDRVVQYQFDVTDLPEELRDRIPAADVTPLELLFNGAETVMRPVPEEEGNDEPEDRRGARLVAIMRQRSASRSDNERLLATHVVFDDRTISETREFLGRTFFVTDTLPAYQWRLTAAQGEFMGYVVQKATAAFDSSYVEAWFTPQIPVSAGPASYGGLPGMILIVDVDHGQTVYTATGVELSPVEIAVFGIPDDGRVVSRDEYERIVAERLREREAMIRGWRRDRRR